MTPFSFPVIFCPQSFRWRSTARRWMEHAEDKDEEEIEMSEKRGCDSSKRIRL
jgi:hypothetical protein